MNNLLIDDINIEDMIYEVRGKQVMLDSDLAKLYHVETKRINEAVKNNPDKFPERFSWKLSMDETILFSRSKNSTLKNKQGYNLKYRSRVFTEQGVAMLATILKSKVAVEVSIRIMDAFVAMKKYISNNLIEQKYINDLVIEHDSSIKLLQESFELLSQKRKASEIYYNGQIYDAYSMILDLFKEAKENIIIIDNYADKTILDIIRRLKVKVNIITKENNLLTTQDIVKYYKQYNNLNVIYNDSFHDRYFIIVELVLIE